MPTISIFYGIIVLMNPLGKEHNPSHIHAKYQSHEAQFRIDNGAILNGYLPSKAVSLVREFILTYQKELLEMWDSQNYKKLKGIQ